MPAAALVFAGKSVATPAISFLVNKAFGYLNQYWNIEDVGEMKNRILNSLPKIQAVFDVINQDRIKEKSSALDALLWQLRDAVDKAQDAVDEVEYYELKEKAEDRKVSDWGSSFAKMRHSAIKSIKHASIVDKVVKSLSHRGTLKRLKKALEGLDKAASGVGDFLAIAGYRDGSTSRQEDDFHQDRDRETGSMTTAQIMFGRRKEEQIIGWLTKPSVAADAEIEEINNNVSIVSIVGHGGMGKTTLAQHICEDGSVKHHFDKVIWACVSTSFNAKDIIRKILGSAGWEAPSANQLDPLQKILREKLSSLKFLLVLDDVWEDKDGDQWEKLLASLRIGKSGSKILLTTRVKEVAELAAKVTRCESDSEELQGLEEDDNIDLFKHHAFSRSEIQDYAALQPIGEQISRNLKGCPLVTKVIASDLRDHLDIQYWSTFLDERLKHFSGSHADIMDILKLSYYHLPTEEQTCFRYCSIFPQDYKFTKAELVEMWASSGLILQTDSERCPVDFASDCLHHLTKKSFFDVEIIKQYGEILLEKYVMHDLMHDLAKCVSFGECARIDGVASLQYVVRTVRHVCFGNINDLPVEMLKANISRLENLRTIIIEYGQYYGLCNKDVLDTVEKLVESSKSLRLFKTKLWHTSLFPEKLAKLMHLRFVELQNTSQESMSGVFRLYHLTTLNWKPVKIESRQVRDVGNLDRLRNLSFGPNRCMVPIGFSMVPVGRLSSLRISMDYYVRREKGYNISALKNLRSLQELYLPNLENVDNQEEAMEAMLKEKKDLKSLGLAWRSSSNGSQSKTQELILEKLEPPANLKELFISGFSGSTFPHWIAEPSVKKLVRLEFITCENIGEVPMLEKFQDLKHLNLYHLPRLERISHALSTSGDECTEVFLPPCLHTLMVKQCSKLEELPLLPPSLEYLEIEHVGLTRLPRIRMLYDENGEIVSSKLLHIQIASCPNLTSLEGSLFEQKQHMGVLGYLRVTSCVNLESAPLPLEEMNGLREMCIEKCPKLRMQRSVEDKLLPSSLEVVLRLEQCGDSEHIVLESLQVFNNLRSLALCNCSAIVSLPSADMFMNMKSLQDMNLTGCENLSSLGGLGSLPHLTDLIILNCSKLTEAGLQLVPNLEVSGCQEEPRSFLKIESIDIDHLSLLLLEPLKSLCPTDHLGIRGGSDMLDVIEPWLLHNCTSLRYLLIFGVSLELLPASLRHLSNLKSLDVYGSDQLRALSNLPSSLERLFIEECHPELRKKATGHGSLKWNEISHITWVRIGDCHFRNGESTFREEIMEAQFPFGVNPFGLRFRP